MSISPYDAWAMGHVLAHGLTPERLEGVSPRWKASAERLAGKPVEARGAEFNAILARLPKDEADALEAAMDAIDSDGPAPPVEPQLPEATVGRMFATLADVAKEVSSQPWFWRDWIASGVLNVVAADPGTGKTRLALDLARRLYFALPFPDGQPNPYPAGTRTLWIQGDRNFAEMLQASRDYGLPDEAVTLGSSPEEPFGSLDLDDAGTLADIAARIEAAAVPLVVIDTLGMVTARNLCRPEEARAFFSPILEMAQRSGSALLGLTHLSANKEALGRRVVEKARSVIKLTQPDPEGQPDRRRLWVDKTAVVKPPALGVTMTTNGNEYDLNPPQEPEDSPRKPGPPPAKLEECKTWLRERLTPNPAPVKDVRSDAEKAGFSASVLYKAKKAIGADEYADGPRKWWKLPLVQDVQDKDPSILDNADKSTVEPSKA